MLSNIKNIFAKDKKIKILIFLISFFIIISIVFSYLENNIQKIISNEFSKKSNYSLKLDDVDFNISGNLAFENIIIFNSKEDTIFYSPKITINPKSVQNALVNNNYNFENIFIQDALLYQENLEEIDFLKAKLDQESNLFIRNLSLKKLKVIFNKSITYLDFEIENLSQVDELLNFSLFNSKIDIIDNKVINDINADIELIDSKILINNLNFLVDSSIIKANIIINDISQLDSINFSGSIDNSKIISSDFINSSRC